MSYLLKSKPRRGYPWKAISIVSLFIFFSLFSYLFPVALRTISYDISKPIWFLSDVTTNSFTKIRDFFILKNDLIKENLSLKDQVVELQLKTIDYDTVVKENQGLKNQYGRVESSSRILSGVLSKPPLSPYDTLIIDVGASQGVTLGNKVYLSGNIIIGLITSVTSRASLVRLFSSGGEKQEAILSRTGASFELVGRGGENLQIEVPKDTDILWGDSFVYPGLSSSIIGNVYYIDTNSQSSFKTIYLRIPGNVFSSKYVFVEKSL